MKPITELQPSGIWQNFYRITQVPRPSGFRQPIHDFYMNCGKELGLETLTDKIGNVLIRKPATPGYENHPGVILQAHQDMVPQKNSDKVFDFEKDPIEAYIEENGEWVTANGTTLGADNGIGAAAALAILADKNVQHPPIEAFFTVDEETGMYGAFALEGGFLQGKTLLNLDTEVEGEFDMGCAGGVDTTATFTYQPVEVEEGDAAIKVTLRGLKGGHSGVDIHLQRASANKLMFRFLKDAVANCEARLVYVNGGSLRNAIAREAEAVITVPKDGVDDIFDLVDEYETLFVKEYINKEDNIQFRAEEVECPTTEMPEDVQDFLIHAVTICPHGVYRMMDDIPGVVETSNNVAMVQTDLDKHEVTIMCLTRSAVESRKEELRQIIDSTFRLAGADVVFSGSYPGWQPNINSPIMHLMVDTYKQEFGQEPQVLTIHAGLECGIIGRNYPGMDMISFGPTIEHPHSPDERVNIATVAKFWQLLVATLKKL